MNLLRFKKQPYTNLENSLTVTVFEEFISCSMHSSLSLYTKSGYNVFRFCVNDILMLADTICTKKIFCSITTSFDLKLMIIYMNLANCFLAEICFIWSR